MYEAECPGCDSFLPMGDLGLCAACSVLCERDLIRIGDWEYSTSAYGLTAAQRETLRTAVIKKYGQRNELLSPNGVTTPNGKRRRSRGT